MQFFALKELLLWRAIKKQYQYLYVYCIYKLVYTLLGILFVSGLFDASKGGPIGIAHHRLIYKIWFFFLHENRKVNLMAKLFS